MPQVKWGQKPADKKAVAPETTLDNLVMGKTPTRRLNLNISKSLHSRVKSQCALEGRDMKEVLVELLEERFPERG